MFFIRYHLKNVCVFSSDLEVVLKKIVASPVHSDALKSDVLAPFTSSLVSTAHPPRTGCRDSNDMI